MKQCSSGPFLSFVQNQDPLSTLFFLIFKIDFVERYLLIDFGKKNVCCGCGCKVNGKTPWTDLNPNKRLMTCPNSMLIFVNKVDFFCYVFDVIYLFLSKESGKCIF